MNEPAPTATRKKVGIILDNPQRDLPGNVLLSYFLVKQGFDVYLIPMYDQFFHVFSIRPDLVLANYARSSNCTALKAYHQARIIVAVMDTEGGVFQDEYKEFVQVVLSGGAKDYVNHYFFWGKRPMEAYRKTLGDTYTKHYLTGSPRMDFYHPRWTHAVQRPSVGGDHYIFIPLSFPFNNPRFSSPRAEVDTTVRILGLDRNTMTRKQAIMDQYMRQALGFYEKVFQKYPDITFVMRPHPFESETPYTERFGGIRNVQIRRDGNLVSWLKYSRLVIQFNSSTAIEAGMLGKPVISLEMFRQPEIYVPVISNCTLQAHTEEIFFELFDLLSRGKTTPALERMLRDGRETIQSLIQDWFYKIDGGSAERVANHIADILRDTPRQSIVPPPVPQLTWRRLPRRLLHRWKDVTGAVSRKLDSANRMKRTVKAFSDRDVREIFTAITGEPVHIDPVRLFDLAHLDESVAVRLRM